MASSAASSATIEWSFANGTGLADTMAKAGPDRPVASWSSPARQRNWSSAAAATDAATAYRQQLKHCTRGHDAPRSSFMRQQRDGFWMEYAGCNDCQAHTKELEATRQPLKKMGIGPEHWKDEDEEEETVRLFWPLAQ